MPNIPKNVFIVPYKNRPQHKYFFSNYLNIIMDDRDDYKYIFHINATIVLLTGEAQKISGF